MSLTEYWQTLESSPTPRYKTGAGTPAAGASALEAGPEAVPQQEEDLGFMDYAADAITAIPKGIVGAARDVVSLPYMPMQIGLDLPEIPDYFGMFEAPKTTVGSIVDTLSGFATGYGAVARGLGMVGRGTTLGIRAAKAARAAEVAAVQRFGAAGGRAAAAGRAFVETSAKSAITSGLVFDGNEARLSNLLREEAGFTDPVTEYLAASDDDGELEGRLKNMIEDFLLGGVAEIGIQAVKASARVATNQLRIHRAGVKAKLAGLNPDEAVLREMGLISQEQAVSISRAMNTTLDESETVLQMIDATGAPRENFVFMTRTETEDLLRSRGVNPDELAKEAAGFATMGNAGKVMIGAFQGADLDTAIHEVAHGIRMMVVDPTVANKILMKGDIDILADISGASRNADGTVSWSPEAEENFVDMFTEYLAMGVAANKSTRRTFSKLTGWVREMYASNKVELDARMAPEVRQAFNNLMNNGVDQALNVPGRIVDKAEILTQARQARRFDAKAALPTRGKAAQLRKMNLLSDEEWASIKSPAALNQLIDNYTALDRDITPLFKALSEAGAPGQGGYTESDMLLRPRIGDTRTELAAMFSGATSAQNKVANHTTLGIGMTADFVDRIKTGNFADISAQEMEQIVKAVGKRHGIRGMSAGYAKTATRIANDLLGRMRQVAEADPSKPVDDIINEVDTSGLYMNLKGAGMAPGAGKTPGYAEGAAGRLDRPALDTYMVRILPDKLFPGLTGSKLLDAKKKWIAKAPNYASMVAIVRKLATTMDILPGENQERIWTSIFGVIGLKRMGVPAENVLKNMDAKDILASWDLLEIVTQPKVINELKRLGFDEGSIADISGIVADVRKAARPFLEGGPGVSDPAAFARAARRISGGGGVSVITARRARGALIKAELSDFSSPEGIKGILKRDDWAVLTAENPNNQTLSAADNAARNAQLEQDLIREGLEYIKITGKYGKALENSFIVVGVDPNRAMRLGRVYGQEAVLTREGMNYRDGTVNPAKKVKILGNKVPDYYSEVSGTKFALDIDWGQKVQSQLISPPPASIDPVLLRQTQQAADFGGPERLLFQKRPGRIGISPTFKPKAEYGKRTPGASSVVGVHFSPQEREVLDSSFYASNWPGEEAARLASAKDKRLMKRTYFYVDTSGEGIQQEIGVGQQMHAVRLNNMYDASKDPKGVIRKANSDDPNVWESAIIKAGYDGYFTNQDMAVVLGQHKVPVQFVRERFPGDRGTILKQARAARQFTTTPGSPGLGTPAGRRGEPKTTINFARFSTEQEANETVKETLESYLDDIAAEDTLELAEQVRRSQPALDELNAALGMQDFGKLDSFITESNEKAGVIRDVSHRVMAARQVMADAGSFAARIAKRHSEASQEEMYDFLRAMQIVKRYGYEVKVQMREIARALGAQRAVYVPDPDFKIPPMLPREGAQVPPQGMVQPPVQALPEAPATGALEAPTMPQEASGALAPIPGASGAAGPVIGATPPVMGATPPAGAAPEVTPAIAPEVAAKARAQFILDAGGEQAVRARMRKVAMAEASGNPLAVTKLSRMDRFGNVLTEYFMNSILSGPATHVVNILGNTLVSTYLPLEKALGASIRGIAGGMGPAESFRMAGNHLKPYRHMYHAFMDSFTFAGAAFKADKNILENVSTVEFKPRAISASNMGMAEGTLAAQAVNWLGTVLNIPTRVLSSTDEFFKQINYRAALMTELEMEGMQRFGGDAVQASLWAKETAERMITEGQAYSEKVVMQKAMMEADKAVTAGNIQPDERSAFIARFMADSNNWDEDLGVLSDRAMDYSRYATFTTPLTVGEGGRISRVSARIQQLAEESTIVRFVMPFIRTPTRILEFALDRTIPGQASNLRNAFGQLKGQLTHAQRSVRDEAMGRVAFAVMSTYGLFHLIHAGGITGDGPSNPTERDAWLQAGNQPYSIKFGDKWISYRRLDPFASMMGLVVDTVESYSNATERQRPQMQSVVNAIIVGLANNFTNKSYLTGVSSLLEAIKDPERYGDKLVYQYVSATVPFSSALRQAKAGFADDLVVRDVRSMLDAVRNTVPGAATAVMPRRNMFGDPVERAQGLGPDIFSPITYTTVKDDLIMKELDLIGHSFDSPREVRNGMDLSAVVGKSGQTAYDRWLELHGSVKVGGQTLRQAMTRTIRSRPYQMMSPETTDMYESPRVRALRTLVEKYRAAAFKQLMREFPEVDQGVTRDFATKRALKTGRPVQELMSLANR